MPRAREGISYPARALYQSEGGQTIVIVVQRCCGLDVHQKTVVACLLLCDPKGRVHKEVRTFGTTTPELLELVDWLVASGCTHVAMESTGVYWKPIYNLLEGVMEVLVVNAQHIKAVPGRKTDVCDAEWIAQLLQHGLLRGSFIPPQPLRELRELVRYRKTLAQTRSAEVNRVQKTLEGANIKLAFVATDVMGVSSRMMLQALIEGATDPQAVANLAKGRLKKKRPELERALSGRVGDHQRFLLQKLLAHIEFLEAQITACGQEIDARTAPVAEKVERLATIPGVDKMTAQLILAEIGPDMARFPTYKHLASWAGVCPGNHESAGKRKSGKTRKGSHWLRSGLVQAAGTRSSPLPRYVPLCPVSSPRRPSRCQSGRSGPCACHSRHRVPHPQGWHYLPGAWSQLLRSTRSGTSRKAAGTPA